MRLDDSGTWCFGFQVTDETSCCLIAVNTSTWRSASYAATWTCWCRRATAGVPWPREAWWPCCCLRTSVRIPTEARWPLSRGWSIVFARKFPSDFPFFFLSLTYIHIIHHIYIEIIILVILMTNENVHCSKIHICMYLKYTTVLRWKSLQSLDDSSYVLNNSTSICSSVDFEAEACGSWLYFPPSTG